MTRSWVGLFVRRQSVLEFNNLTDKGAKLFKSQSCNTNNVFLMSFKGIDSSLTQTTKLRCRSDYIEFLNNKDIQYSEEEWSDSLSYPNTGLGHLTDFQSTSELTNINENIQNNFEVCIFTLL
ncbi:hypothetical protein TKK_0002899 [Trichogramma kaykai]